jgi:hypothetical protein
VSAIAATDFLALAQSGAALRTRDRRAVALTGIDAAAGLLRGRVAMEEGELNWRRDGSFAGAPPGVAGPLDLVAPAAAAHDTRQRASLRDALNEDDARDRAPFCCD